MTVHGAKGLEAPVVILADTMTPPAGSAAAAAAAACRRRDDLGGPQGRRRAECRRGAQRGARRSRARIPPAALRRHDARRRPADHVRRRRRATSGRQAAGTIWCASALEAAARRGRRRTTKRSCAIRKQQRRQIADRAASPRAAVGKPTARELPSWLRQPAPAEAPRRTRISPSSAFEEEIGRASRDGGLGRRAAKGACARPHRASADAIAARHSAGRAARTPSSAISKRRRRFYFRRAGRDGASRCSLSSTTGLCRSVRAGKPRRGADRRPHRARRRCPIAVSGRWTGWR